MELKWLEDFQSLSKQGNFSAAAKERNVTQPAFSRRIQALEYWLGVTLFDRTSYPVSLTEHGKKFQPVADELILKIRNLKYDFSQLSVQSEQNVRITCMHTIAVHYLPALTRQVFTGQGDHTDIRRYNLIVNPSVQGIDNHFSDLFDENSDILITFSSSNDSLAADAQAQLEKLVIGKERYIPVICAERFTELQLDTVSPAQTEVPYLSYSEFTFLDRLLKPAVEQSRWRLLRVYESSLSESIKNMTEQGMGMAWLPESLIGEQLAQGRLRQIPSPQAEVEVELHAYRLKSCRRSAVQDFWRAIAQVYPPV